ncbi:MAG: hypothetical protein ACYC9O_09500, partial [Candidatus Latescibacterota bacterium]
MRKVKTGAAFLMLLTIAALPAFAGKVTTTWSGDAKKIYDEGFMHMLMKNGEGVCLFNLELLENDAPGAGFSEKGISSDRVWGKNRARKILTIDDPRGLKAWLVLFTTPGKYPLQFDVNGNRSRVECWDLKTCHLPYRWVEFPTAWLRKGRNTIELCCPEAQKESEGWPLYLARADEFEQGGGNPVDVGKTSFKSIDGGETWKESPFGPLGQDRCEYTIRISFDRHVKTGWLATPVIDLWRGNGNGFIVPVRVFKKVKVSLRADVPAETSVQYYLRTGVDPGPFASGWSNYELIGSGAAVDREFSDLDLEGRFVQIRAVLATTNPLKTPVIRSAEVTTELMEGMPLHESLKAGRVDNPVIKYSSVEWEWEGANRSEYMEVRK